jgi:hypothetical protein
VDRANYRKEQQDNPASQLLAAKQKHVAQREDHPKRKIYGGPARPSDVQHSYGLDE